MAKDGEQQLRLVMLGTYDLGKPRTRLLLRAMQEIDADLVQIHHNVWSGIEDKSLVTGIGARLSILFKLLIAYPLLALRYAFAGRHDVVVVGYMGLFDMLLLAPLAKLRGKPIVWDAFLSVYDTYARDRGLGEEGGLKARILRKVERLACRIADQVVLDTQSHAELMGKLHAVADKKLGAVLVGAEDTAFALSPPRTRSAAEPLEVLFYGQFIPLHGIDTIVDAALSEGGRAFRWTIIGQGQEAPRIDALLCDADADHIRRIDWVDYAKLADEMAKADVCLGIFGTSDKASRVIPNKVYQALSAGKPLVTRDSPAMRELVQGDRPYLQLTQAGDADSLLRALEAIAQSDDAPQGNPHNDLVTQFAFPALVEQWQAVLEKAEAK